MLKWFPVQNFLLRHGFSAGSLRYTPRRMAASFTNRLAEEKSPYLLQHQHNPVDWWPWGPDAFNKARELNRPVFLSIGYSTCHWCHVMAHESFEDAEIARFLNDHFVAIKVDREERPDIDKAYMTFVQALSGQGGWPLSVFLSPAGQPFLGGTYFPPRDSPQQSGFLTVLKLVAEKWEEDPAGTAEHAASLGRLVHEKLGQRGPAVGLDLADVTRRCLEYYKKAFDAEGGGFGLAPKFPEPSNLVFLADFCQLHKDRDGQRARDMAVRTLERMAAGGIHDHVGHGFHRYSVDPDWHVPHFEKMLYDQAQLLTAYARFAALGEPFQEVVEDIVAYVKERLLTSSGGFYSAEDADSLPRPDSAKKTEGAFYVWTRDETDELLEDTAPACNENITLGELLGTTFDVRIPGNVPGVYDPHGELTGKNVLIRKQPVPELAKQFKMSVKDFKDCLADCCQILKADREAKRVRPHRDNKVITAWNALMISGLVHAAEALPEKARAYMQLAQDAEKFISAHLVGADGSLLRTTFVDDSGAVQKGTDIKAVADDYAFLIRAYLDLFEFTFEDRFLKRALALQELFDQKFFDHEDKTGYFLNEATAELYTRPKSDQDGAEPCYNSVACENLARLFQLLGEQQFKQRAEQVLEGAGALLRDNPYALPYMISAAGRLRSLGTQVVLVTQKRDASTDALLEEVRRKFIAHRVLILVDKSVQDSLLLARNPHLAELTGPVRGQEVLVCRDFACTLPVTELEALRQRLEQL